MRMAAPTMAVFAVFALITTVSANGKEARKSPDSYVWNNVTIGGGGFAPGLIFSPAKQGLAYLRTDMGGAYRWDADQRRWRPLQDGVSQSSFMGIESLAPDPHDERTVYLAAGMGSWGPAAIFRSNDQGQHWAKTLVPFRMGGNENGRGLGERLAVDPADTAHLLFGSRHDGLWQSHDHAAHWSKVAGFPLPGLGKPASPRHTHGGLSFVLFDPMVPGRVFVASADPGTNHLFRSDNHGRTWRAVKGGPAPDMLPVKAVVGSDHVLTITYSNAIGPNGITKGAVWRFDPAGDQWFEITPRGGGAGCPGGYMGVAVSRQNPQVIAVSTVDRSNPVDTVWRSSDAGRHWDELYRRSVRDVSATPFLDFDGKANFGHWIAGLAIDPFDADHAAYTTGATVYATREFGTSGTMHWKPWTSGIEQTAVITLISPTGGAHLISGFGDIGGFRHDDLHRSPRHIHLNPFLTNTNTLDYAGIQPNIVVRSGNTHASTVPVASLAWSNDGGDSWHPLTPPLANGHTDGSATPLETGDAAITVSADGNIFLIEGDQPRLTRDRGAHWSNVKGLPSGVRVRATADKVDPRRFYAIDFSGGKILRSNDGGATFHPVESVGLPRELSSALTHNREAPNPLLATPGKAGMLWLQLGKKLYRSVDFGRHWVRTNGNLQIIRYGLGMAAENSRWPTLFAFADMAQQRGIYRSTDGGNHWKRINDDQHQWGLRIRMLSGDPRKFGRVYVATDGRGIIYGDPKGMKQ